MWKLIDAAVGAVGRVVEEAVVEAVVEAAAEVLGLMPMDIDPGWRKLQSLSDIARSNMPHYELPETMGSHIQASLCDVVGCCWSSVNSRIGYMLSFMFRYIFALRSVCFVMWMSNASLR